MSHFKERAEKVCLNCNAALHGTFCHICGQENIEPKESAWHLLTHFFYDITHFDGKFFSTLGLLIKRPGFLTYEYARGRRASYLNPIRMYVFTSAFFFLIFFSFIKPKDVIKIDDNRTVASVINRLEKNKLNLSKAGKATKNKTDLQAINAEIQEINDDLNSLRKDSANISRLKTYNDDFIVVGFWADKYPTRFKYDSIQASLPPEKREGFFNRLIKHKSFDLNEKYKHQGAGIIKIFADKFVHNFPQLLFISLPLFALLLKLIYLRRKKFYYVNHIIFTLHFYIFSFIALLVIFSMTKLQSLQHLHFLKVLTDFLWIGIYFYLYKAMRNFYEQRRAKTIIKFFTLLFFFMIVLVFLFAIFFFYSLFQL